MTIAKTWRIPVNNATPEGVGGCRGICSRWGWDAGAGAVDGATSGVWPVDCLGGEQLRGMPPGQGQPAHGDTVAVRAHDHVQHGIRAALCTRGHDEHEVPVGKVPVRTGTGPDRRPGPGRREPAGDRPRAGAGGLAGQQGGAPEPGRVRTVSPVRRPTDGDGASGSSQGTPAGQRPGLGEEVQGWRHPRPSCSRRNQSANEQQG